MVAAFVLVVGMAGAFALLNGANRTTVTNNARMGATNLARELRRGRALDRLRRRSPRRTWTPALQAKAGIVGRGVALEDQRRGIEYTVTTQVCTFDDPKDNVATLAARQRLHAAGARAGRAPARSSPRSSPTTSAA